MSEAGFPNDVSGDFAEADDFTAESVLAWAVDWDNFTDEYPGIPGDAETWKRRLALALDRGFSTHLGT